MSARVGRNAQLSKGSQLGKLSKTALKSKKGYHTRLGKPAATAKEPVDPTSGHGETKEKKIGGSKNGEKRLVPVSKAAKYYPAEDNLRKKLTRKSAPKNAPLKKSITAPGQVLILLAGKFRGKRVVFLKQLASGLLLVTGPYALNGVPVRRVNQAYVIATSTKVDLSSLKVDEKYTDDFFKKASASRSKGSEAEFFKDGEKPELTQEQKDKKASLSADQKSLDKSIISSISKTPNLAKYLATPFSLSKGQAPHLLKF